MADEVISCDARILEITEGKSLIFYPMINNLITFAGRPKDSVFSFKKVFSFSPGSRTRLMEEAGAKKYGDLSINISEMKMVNRLPFSNHSISTSEVGGSVKIKTNKKNILPKELMEMFPEVNDYINRFTNADLSMQVDQINFFADATLIAQTFANQFKILAPNGQMPKKNSKLSFSVEFEYMEFLLSLESCNPHVVAKYLYKFLTNYARKLAIFKHSAEILADGVKVNGSEPYEPTFIKNLDLLINSTNELVTGLNKIAGTPVSDDYFIEIKNKGAHKPELMPINSTKKFLSNLRNFTSELVSKEIPERKGILNRLAFTDSQIKENTPNYSTVEGWIYTLIHSMFGFVKLSVNQDGLLFNLQKDSYNTNWSMTVLQDFVDNNEQLGIDKYDKVISDAGHLKLTLHELDQASVSNIIETIEKFKTGMKSSIAGLLHSIRYPPSYFEDLLDNIMERYDVDAKWRNKISAMDDYLSGGNNNAKSQKRLTTLIEEHKIFSFEETHKELINVIDLLNESRRIHAQAQTEFKESVKNPSLHASVREELTKLKDALTTLIDGYKKAKNKLFEILIEGENSNKDPVRHKDYSSHLRTFASKCGLLIGTFSDEVEEVISSGIVTHSGPSAAMMVGLGQGGEAIVRATMAKMLNNHTDTRCANLLSGLNININEVVNAIEHSKHENFNFNINVKNKPTEGENRIISCFNKANLVAINAGEEDQQRLVEEQNYNYIWGKYGGQHYSGSKKDKYIKLSENSVLVDSKGKGSGGRMGKGRAHAVAAEAAIEQTFRKKRKTSQSIDQICLVHSYAGGSGSGMILPVLRMIKRVFPTAQVWVLSAGEILNGKSTHDPHNVVYITSDILQSHYNALHHYPEDISERAWNKFSDKIKRHQNSLDTLWGEISKSIPDGESLQKSYENDLEEQISALKQDIQDKVSQNSQNGTYGFRWDDGVKNSVDFLPNSTDDVNQFQLHVRDPRYFDSITSIWRDWNDLSEDPGSYQLSRTSDLQNILRSDDKESKNKQDFPLTYMHLMSIKEGVTKLMNGNFDSEEVVNSIGDLDPENEKPNMTALHQFGAKMNIVIKDKNTSKIEAAEDLIENIKKYASEMRNYHSTLQEHYELIKLNLVMKDDDLVKHIIVSNAHFDVNAMNLAKKSENYEIYNSIMADIFINTVHNLVKNNVESDDDSVNQTSVMSRSSASEAMDQSDVKGRTRPTLGSIQISPDDFTQLEGNVRFERDIDYDKVNESETLYTNVFINLFKSRNSPLFEVVDSIETPKIEPAPLAAFYNNYIRYSKHLLSFAPWEIIDLKPNSREKLEQHCKNFDGKIEQFWNNEITSQGSLVTNELKINQDFGLDKCKNMVYWILMINPEIISKFFSKEEDFNSKRIPKEVFLDFTKNWKDSWHQAFDSGNTEDVTNPRYRLKVIDEFVHRELPDIDSDSLQMMCRLLFDLGVCNLTHLSALPSSFVYDFAPLLISEYVIATDEYSLDMTIRNANGAARTVDVKRFNFVEPRYPTVTNQERGKDREWERERTKMTKRKVSPVSMQISSSKVDTSYLCIRPPTNFTTGFWRYDISPKFIKHFASIKCYAAEKYPHFASNTILNKIIDISSDVNSGMNFRDTSEAPKFKRSRDSLDINAVPRKMHKDESKTSLFLRYLLITNPVQSGEKSYTCAKANIADFDNPWIVEVQQKGIHDFSSTFDPVIFDKNICTRIDSLIRNVDKCKFDDLELQFMIEQVINECAELRGGSEVMQADVLFRKLSKRLYQKMNDYLDKSVSEYDLNKDSIHAELMSVCNLFTRLATISYSAYCQYVFERQPKSQEFGVSYDYEGSLDAIRSNQADYLVVVNGSFMADLSSIRRSVNYFYQEYLGHQVSGKVFSQLLEQGPICNISIIQERAGLTEVSDKFTKLMEKISESKWDTIRSPLVHPYSFLRNILWLPTFMETWVHKPSKSFVDSMNIPDDVILDVFGQPELIEQTKQRITTDSFMKGLELSRYDKELWDSVWLCATDINEKSEDEKIFNHYKQRIRGHLHIPDLLLILAAKQEFIQGNKSTFKEALTFVANQSGYLEPKWGDKFEHDGVESDFTFLKQDEDNAETSDDEDDFWGGGAEPSESPNYWITALTKWVEFLEKGNQK